MIKCSSCHTENPEEFKFCENCGARLDVISCPQCSHENPREYKFCEECGASLSEQTTEEESRVAVKAIDEKKSKVEKPIKATHLKEEAPQAIPEPASPPKRVSRPRRKLKPKPTSIPKSRSEIRKTKPKRPAPEARSRKRPQPVPRTRRVVGVAYKSRFRVKPKKQSYFKRVVLPMVSQAFVRFVVSTITGFLLGKAGLLVSTLLK